MYVCIVRLTLYTSVKVCGICFISQLHICSTAVEYILRSNRSLVLSNALTPSLVYLVHAVILKQFCIDILSLCQIDQEMRSYNLPKESVQVFNCTYSRKKSC